MKVIETFNLTKKLKNFTAVENISIKIESGEIYGFVGLNGAGKTTTIRLLLGMLKPTVGNILLFGRKISEDFNLWNDIGYIVEFVYAYPNLTVRENLELFFNYRKLKDKNLLDNIIERLNLVEYQNIIAKNLSLGNLQRLGLARALIHKPKLLILGEPLNGLDPAGIIEMRGMFKELSNNEVTIFISSHNLAELEKLATKIGIIHKGKLIKELIYEDLEKELEKKLIIITNNDEKAIKLLTQKGFQPILNDRKEILLYEKEAVNNSDEICKFLTINDLSPKLLYPFEEDLESYFIRTIRNEGGK